jgi:hypothetical protein
VISSSQPNLNFNEVYVLQEPLDVEEASTVGTFEVVGKESLMLFGVGEEVALGFMLVLHAALWLPITMLGFYYMARESISWDELSAAQRTAEEEGRQKLAGEIT